MIRRFNLCAPALLLLTILLFVNTPSQAADLPAGVYSASPRGEKVTLTFDGKNKFTVKRNDEIMVEGTYKVTKDRIEFTGEKGPRASKDSKPGTYTWKVEDKKLTFTKIEDEAEGRARSLTAEPWTKEP